LGDRLRNFNDGRDFIEKAQKYLFEDLGFHGNEADYFDPLNSCLNQVLERRTGDSGVAFGAVHGSGAGGWRCR